MTTMTIDEMAVHFGIGKRTLHTLYYRRKDCPAPVGFRSQNKGGKRQPEFNVSEFETYLKELGLINRELAPDRMTLLDVQSLLNVSFTHTKHLMRTDKKFPRPLINKSFHNRMKHWVFDRAEVEAYARSRPKYKDRLKVSPKPIKMTGNKRKDVINFLSAPSPLRPRKKTTGKASTTRVRTEGVVGVWK